MGMGVFFLAILVLLARFNIMEANAVKIASVALYTIVVLAIFAYKGMVDWKIGLILASGQAIGGWLGAEFGSKWKTADKWAYRLLVVIIVCAVFSLFGVFDNLFK